MHYHIKDLLLFIRKYDNTGLFKNKSNTELRKYIRACLHKSRFYFIIRRGELIGIVEWYRIRNCKYLLTQTQQHRYLNSNPSGNIIFIHNSVFKLGSLTVRIFKQFIRYHKNINRIIWFKHKNKKFKSIKIGN